MPSTGERVFGMQVDLNLQRTAAHIDHTRYQLDQLPLTHGDMEVDLLRTRGDDRATGETRGRDERSLVHPGQRLPTKQGAKVVGMVGEHDFPDSRLARRLGG